MRIITKRALTESWERYPIARQSLSIWEERMKTANCKTHEDLKKIFKDADYIPNENFKHLTAFNIKGNAYRLVVEIFFNTNHVFIKWFGTHADYSRINFSTLPNKGFILC